MNNRERRERKYSTLPSIFLALMMIVTGTLMVAFRIFQIDYNDSSFFVEDNNYGLAGRALLIVGGLAILYFRKKGNYFSVGIYALTLGLSRVIRSLPGLSPDASDFTFYLSLIFVIIGGNLAWGGYNHLTVRTRNPATMRYTAMALLSIYGLALGYSAYKGLDVVAIFLEDINIMGYLPLYAGLLIVLYSRELLENIPLARIGRFLNDMSINAYVGDSINITEEDAKKIEEGFSGADSWDEIDVGGMLIKETVITFHAHNGIKDVILERWPDSDVLYLNLINDRTDSFIGGQRVRAAGYVIEGDRMDLFDSSGVCANIRIGGIDE